MGGDGLGLACVFLPSRVSRKVRSFDGNGNFISCGEQSVRRLYS
jgi:hypothetical protein